MPDLNYVYDSEDDIPEGFRELYSERNGKFEVTAIQGIRTQADVDRVNEGLRKEKNDHKESKAQLQSWISLGALEDVQAKLDRFPELEAAAEGKLDDAAIEELVQKRVKGAVSKHLAPLERQVEALTSERDTLAEENLGFKHREVRRRVHDEIRTAAKAEKLLDSAVDDALLLGEREFEVDEDGNVFTNEASGSAGRKAKDWLSELRDKRAHWWPDSQGGGAPGSGPGGRPGGKNPFSAENWNMTEQMAMIKEDRPRAERLAKAAGTTIGGTRPAFRKK